MLASVVAGCTVDDQIVTEIGTTQLLLADSQLLAPIVTSTSDFTVQTSVWTVERAELILAGRVIDLTFGEDCTFIDSYSLSAPTA